MVAHHARLQCALVAVKRGTPGILRIGSVAIRAMRPHHGQIAELERRGLRIGDVRLAALSTRMPPDELTRAGIPKSNIQRTMSSMWTHISPMMPLPYSMKARQRRGCTRSLYGRIGAGPVHIS